MIADTEQAPSGPLLEIRDLSVDFRQAGAVVHAVRGVSLRIDRGETVALVGESGSGKSVTALSILQLLRHQARYPSGSIVFHEPGAVPVDLMRAPVTLLERIRGNRIGMIFQEPMTSLNPLHTVERQVGEVLRVHRRMRPALARARVIGLLRRVGLPDPERRLGAYPHELSGGQRQRVMIAMALANEPDLLIADEPTTALDVTIQAQILELLRDLQREERMAMLMITHDLGIVRRMAGRVSVMQDGAVVEEGDCRSVFEAPRHPYTIRLLNARSTGRPPPPPPQAPELVRVEDLRVHFPIRRGLWRRTVDHVRAVDGISFTLRERESVGLVGESGSGKTTAALALLRLIADQAARLQGTLVFQGADISRLDFRGMRPLRRHLQVVFQDPYGSLSPRMTVGDIVAEGLPIHRSDLSGVEADRLVADTLARVGLDPETRHRYPHEFSGGQRQRIALARALVLRPQVLVLDEPTSALDMTVQKDVIALLHDLQEREGLSYLFISHDLRVVRALCHHILVLRQGRVVEQGPADEVIARPRDPYTRSLMTAAFDLRPLAAPPETATEAAP